MKTLEINRIFKKTKVERMIYIVILFWVVFAVLGHIYLTPFVDLSAYFVSLIGFVSSYIYGENKSPSDATPLFSKGKNSSREIMMYVVILIWLGFGSLGIVEGKSLVEFSSYFATLTPFVGAYILGKSANLENVPKIEENVDNLG